MKIKKLMSLTALILSCIFVLSACQNEDKQSESTFAPSGQTTITNAAHEESSSESAKKTENGSESKTTEKEPSTVHSSAPSNSFEPVDYEEKETEPNGAAIGSKLKLVSLGSSNGVMCAEVKNISDFDIEYCVLKASADGKNAEFVLSVLPNGETAIVFEKNKMNYSKSFLNAAWSAQNEVLFSEKLGKMENVFETHCTDGALEIKNISADDVEKTIYICYKSTVSGKLSGSVSYRMKIGAIKKGETKQLFSKNVSQNSRVMYIRYGS